MESHACIYHYNNLSIEQVKWVTILPKLVYKDDFSVLKQSSWWNVNLRKSQHFPIINLWTCHVLDNIEKQHIIC